MKFRIALTVVALTGATLGGAAIAQASPAPTGPAGGPMSPETCLAHHPDLSDAERAAMADAMASGDVGAMASLMGPAMGPMASMMGGEMGHLGLRR